MLYLVIPENVCIIFSVWVKIRTQLETNDVKRVRIGPKQYSSHVVHILEKTQTEICADFISKNPEIRISQRLFEACKPYYIRPAR